MSMNTFNPVAAQTPAAATDAVCTMAAPTDGSRWVLSVVQFSYTATPTGGKLIIAWTDPTAGAVSETYYISAGGPGSISWPVTRRWASNVAVTITLKSGAGSVVGSVYPWAWTEL